jgi:PAS domain S-box-containing protein
MAQPSTSKSYDSGNTQRHGHDQALRDAEERYGALFDRSRDAVFLSDFKGHFIDANQAALDMFGYTREEIPLVSFSDLLGQEDIPKAFERIKELLATGAAKGLSEWQAKRKDGSRVWVEIQGSLVCKAGKPFAVQGIARDITERKALTDLLRLSEEKFKLIFNTASDAIFVRGLDGFFIEVNDAACQMLGYSREELLRLTPMDIDKSQTAKSLKERVGTLKGKNVLLVESEHLTKDKRRIPVELNFRLIEFEGRPAVLSIARDITKRKITEEALGESEQFAGTVISSVAEGIVVYDKNLHYKLWNKFMEDVSGVPAQDLLGKCALDVFPALRQKGVDKLLRRALAGEVVKLPDTHFVVPQNRKSVWLAGCYFPHRNAKSEIIGVIAFLQEVTERRKIERSLRASATRFRSLIENAPESICISRDGKIIYLNPMFRKIFSFNDSDSLEGRTIFDYVAPQCHAEIEKRNQSREAGEPVPGQYESIGLRKDGSQFPIQICANSIPLSEGIATLAFISDITERKQAEEKLLAYQGQLRALASKLSLTEERERHRLATVLHDRIGQNLALCRIKLEMCEAQAAHTPLEPELEGVLGTLKEIIAETRALTFELSPPVLYEVGLDAALNSLAEYIQKQSGIRCVCQIEGEPAPISNDLRAILFQAARELMINAVKHSQANEIFVNLKFENEQAVLIVRDNGRGFRPYANQKANISGFGLFSLRERLIPFGGACDIRSEPGQGACISLTAPLSKK